MILNRIKPYPLKWFDSLLSLAIKPFVSVKTIEKYATNGYYLLGIVLAAVTLLLWGLGLLGGTLSQLPAWLRDGVKFALGLIGLKEVPETIPLILLIALLYWGGYFVKRVRLFIGEKFANLFFGVANVGITTGELCLEHRWLSLFIVIGLAVFITWGGYYIFETTRRNDKLIDNFGHWLDQVDEFSDKSTVSLDESHSYKQVNAFWNDDYLKVVESTGGSNHPAFALHKMLDELYSDKPSNRSWWDILRESLPKLTKYMAEYQSREKAMKPSEKRAWALMNILMGRVYARLGDRCDKQSDCPELIEARKYFSAISEQYQYPADKRYRAAAQNGRGTIYANIATSLLRSPTMSSPQLRSICSSAAECASLALAEYGLVEGEECSFEDRRKENNTIDILARIALYYDRSADGLRLADINLSNVCSGYIGNQKDLADCLEGRVKKLMSCAAHDPFIPLIFITAAQSYGVSVELKRKANPDAEVEQDVIIAGKYLRLAYVLNKGSQENMTNWGFCYFRFALRDKKLGEVFMHAVTSGVELPSMRPQYLTDLIERDMARCQ